MSVARLDLGAFFLFVCDGGGLGTRAGFQYTASMTSVAKRPRDGRAERTDQPRKRCRTVSHITFTWTGQFRREWARACLNLHARPGSCVWDPFVGSGTILLECAALERVGAYGTDMNPAAIAMASVASCANWDVERRTNALCALDAVVAMADNDGQELDSSHDVKVAQQDRLIGERASASDDVRTLIDALLCCSEKTSGGPVASAIADIWPSFRAFVAGMPHAASTLRATWNDARQSGIPSASVDLIVTSPPYVNVINYHQQYRALMERMGKRILGVAPSEIGANRKHRSNRMLTVIQYCLDMEMVLAEMARVCKPSARAILVVGRESMVEGATVRNSHLIERLAIESGQWARASPNEERSFTNRFGRTIIEDILHLAPTSVPKGTGVALCVAADALGEAKTCVPPAKQALLEGALRDLHRVKPSPLLHATSQ